MRLVNKIHCSLFYVLVAGEIPVDDTVFGDTATDNPHKVTLKTLRCPKTSREKLDKYFELWNVNGDVSCYKMPFWTNYNHASYQSEQILYDFLGKLNEPMLLVNSYQHNTRTEGGESTGITDTGQASSVSEVDVLVVHKVYGLLLFEVKDLREVNFIRDPCEGSAQVKKTKKSNKKDRCPLEMITDAEKQLVEKWKQITGYLLYFFKDQTTKEAWATHWNVNVAYVDAMLESITNEAERAKQSFICLFYWDKFEINGENIKFVCERNNCTSCKYSASVSTSLCQVVFHRNLKSFETFRFWWDEYFLEHKRTTALVNIDKYLYSQHSYEFLLNRLQFF